MNIIIFSLTVLAVYGIIRIGYNAFKNADIIRLNQMLDFKNRLSRKEVKTKK